MPEGWNGTNFGSYTLAELTGVLFPSVTDSYFWSLDVDDIWSPVNPVDTVYTPVSVVESVYTSVDVVNTTFVPA
jgi:hypothetical protein